MTPGQEPDGKKTLVVGADGTIGRALTGRLESSGHRVWKTSRRRESTHESTHDLTHDRAIFLDLADDPSRWSLPPAVSTAFICAGQSSTQYCRLHPEESRAINVDKTVALARQMTEAGMRVIFLSTDLVFDGEVPYRAAHDRTCPRTEYGRQKAAAEELLLSLGDGVVVVRLTKVIGPDNELLDRWRSALRKNAPIHPFFDKVCAPVSLGFVTGALTRLTESAYGGIVQISGRHDVTYEELARRLALKLGAPVELVQPRVAEGGEPHKPLHSALDTSSLQAVLGMAPESPWAFLDALM